MAGQGHVGEAVDGVGVEVQKGLAFDVQARLQHFAGGQFDLFIDRDDAPGHGGFGCV